MKEYGGHDPVWLKAFKTASFESLLSKIPQSNLKEQFLSS